MSDADTNDTDLIIIRPSPGLPPGYLPSSMNGQLVERAAVADGYLVFHNPGRSGWAVASGRFENVDGKPVEVYEVFDHKPER